MVLLYDWTLIQRVSESAAQSDLCMNFSAHRLQPLLLPKLKLYEC